MSKDEISDKDVKEEKAVCPVCGGSGVYYQQHPDCRNCSEKTTCPDYGASICPIPSDCYKGCLKVL